MYPDITRDDVFMLETRRLWLRWPRLSDAQAIVRLAGDKRIADMAMITHPLTQRDAEEFIFHARQCNANGDGMVMMVTSKSRPNAVYGVVSIEHGVEVGKPYLGYWIGAPFWGNGYASEAVEAMIDAFFIYTSEHELTASARMENEASKRVLAKAGLTPCGDVGQADKRKLLPSFGGDIEFSRHGDIADTGYFRIDRQAWSRRLPWVQPYMLEQAVKPVAA